MSDKPVISVENLSKYYRLGLIGGGTLREDLNRAWAKLRGKPDPLLKIGEDHGNRKGGQIWALRDVNLEVKQGEVLGIIGRNGAGKSTLLKILSRITAPTSGRAVIRGRVGSLLEVGTGFHPELTGRENIFLNGAILGMTRAEVARKLEEIVEFAEMAQFIDTPVKRYSSGMLVRLAFAVAAHLEPEILIVDEVLAVGDARFQRKCLGKMKDVSSHGRTVLFVSHNMRSIAQLCDRAIWINRGLMHRDGGPETIIGEYLGQDRKASGTWERADSHPSNKKVHISKVCVLQGSEIPAPEVRESEDIRIVMSFEVRKELANCTFLLRVTNAEGVVVFTTWDTDSGRPGELMRKAAGTHRVECVIPSRYLRPGSYSITVAAHEYGIELFDLQEDVLVFEVSSLESSLNTERLGIVAPVLDWRTLSVSGAADPAGPMQGRE